MVKIIMGTILTIQADWTELKYDLLIA